MKTSTEIITIPKWMVKKDDLVVVLREVKTFKPTAVQKKALLQARKNFKKGNTLTLNELKGKLGLKD